MLEAGFGKVDITPRVGVELCGFGPYICRHSIGVRDRLWARAIAIAGPRAEGAAGLGLRSGGKTVVIVACDLVGVTRAMTRRVRALVREAVGLPDEAVMVSCSHTHSGPNTIELIGWGEADPPYREILPTRIAQACVAAVRDLSEARLMHAHVPCEGIGLNREQDKDAPPLEEVLRDDWRPAKPELTDTKCHVIRVDKAGRIAGFCSYFGCHPVVCCSTTRFIHGDYAGVATNLLEREHPGAVGLFLQGAQGDVNSCVVHKPEQDALLALDVIAGRYARQVRHGLEVAEPVRVDAPRAVLREVTFTRKPITREQLETWLAEREAIVHAPDASDDDRNLRMAMVYVVALRRLIARKERGEPMQAPTEVQGIRVGPLAFLGEPFETMQAIKNDIVAGAHAPAPLVMGITNDCLGYAPDRQVAARGGYAADMVPMMLGQLPFACIHDELVKTMLEVEAELNA